MLQDLQTAKNKASENAILVERYDAKVTDQHKQIQDLMGENQAAKAMVQRLLCILPYPPQEFPRLFHCQVFAHVSPHYISPRPFQFLYTVTVRHNLCLLRHIILYLVIIMRPW